jgi:curved DNA-binding protein CbpA
MADPYSILGVSKGADEKAIKSAYRKLAKELHPDKNKDNPKASARFSEVTQAYDLLSDPKKRGQFDRGEIDENGQPRFTGGNPFGGGGYSQGGPGGGNFDFGSGGIVRSKRRRPRARILLMNIWYRSRMLRRLRRSALRWAMARPLSSNCLPDWWPDNRSVFRGVASQGLAAMAMPWSR